MTRKVTSLLTKAMRKHRITPDLLRAALAYVPSNVDRDTWARVAMAIKSELSDESGFALFDEWSQTDAAGYEAAGTRSTWRSIKPGGGVTVATLLHMAKEGGFVLPRASNSALPDLPALEADTRQTAEHEVVAAACADVWTEAGKGDNHPYLQRKGVKAYGVRAADGWLLVPLRDHAAKVWNIQRIASEVTAGRPSKLFIKGGRKSGLWHWCGDPLNAATVLICEGYATGASLHEATGLPVAVAFDAGNLVHVAKQLRIAYPEARLIVCGDDDAQTAARTGRNTGRLKAQAAAKAADAVAVFPAPLATGQTDFNDLHQARGLDAVRACVEGAFEKDEKSGSPEEFFDCFRVDDAGVWHRGLDRNGKPKSWEWVCSRLDVQAETRDQDGAGWGYLLKFADPRGVAKQWAMPSRMLAGDGGEYRAALLHLGLKIAAGRDTRNLLTQYIQTRQPGAFAMSTERIGWHDYAFVLPRETIGEGAERVVFQSETSLENTFSCRGAADQWRDRVARLCVRNSRLIFSVSCAFAGPLLRPAGIESGGFHLRGDSSSGKTTALRVAASVYGGASYMQRWRTTDNALEVIAAQHNDCLLILDELAQVDPKTAGECAYMLANEQSKARATRTGMPRPRLAWRLLFLSAGELGLADHMAEGMKRTRTGQEVRMADIPADAGAGMGAFEALHGLEGAAAFARHINWHAAATYGAVGRQWLEWLTSNADTLKVRVRELSSAIQSKLIPDGASGQVERVGARFALVAAAGELATVAGMTGWPAGEAESGARACFNAWLAARGGVGNAEVTAMLRQVRLFLAQHGEGRFTWWHRAADDRSAKTLQRAGFRRMTNRDGEPIKSDNQHLSEFGDRMPAAAAMEVGAEFFILAEVFRSEVCQGFDYQAVARVLRDHQCLVTEKDRLDVKTRLPGLGHARVYRIVPKIFELDL